MKKQIQTKQIQKQHKFHRFFYKYFNKSNFSSWTPPLLSRFPFCLQLFPLLVFIWLALIQFYELFFFFRFVVIKQIRNWFSFIRCVFHLSFRIFVSLLFCVKRLPAILPIVVFLPFLLKNDIRSGVSCQNKQRFQFIYFLACKVQQRNYH